MTMKAKLIRAGGLLLCVAVFALLVSLSAHAADLPIKARPAPPPPPPVLGWSGFYLGVNGGYGWGSDPIAVAPASPGAISDFSTSVPAGVNGSPAGGLFGVQLGYNWQWSSLLVLGLETDFDYARIDGAGTVALAPAAITFNTSAAQGLSWLGTVRGRLGFTLDRALIYGTGGLAYGRTSLATSIIGLSGGACGPAGLCASAASTGWQVGWAAGAGIEWAVTPSLSLRAEYLHYDLGTRSVTAFDPAIPLDVFASSAKFSGDIARLGLNFRFGGGGGPVVAKY
jgi:outer membrane immunogenic protein